MRQASPELGVSSAQGGHRARGSSSAIAGAIPTEARTGATGRAGHAGAFLTVADALAVSLKASLARLTLPLARSASGFIQRKGWHPFGFARLQDFAPERFDRSGRWVRDLAALGDALDSIPRLALALTGEDGGPPIGTVAALMIARVTTEESLPAWIELARSVPVRELKQAVRSAREAGSERPLDGGAPGAGGVPFSLAADPDRESDGTLPTDRAPSSLAVDSDDELVERFLVRFMVPEPVRTAFDEALDLYRAVEGHQASATAFVEALVAESASSGRPPDADLVPIRALEQDPASVEVDLARSTGNWSHLLQGSPEVEGCLATAQEVVPQTGKLLALCALTLARVRELEERAGTGGPAELVEQIRSLMQLEDQIERRLGQLLAEMGARAGWTRLRFAGIGHYAEQRLGMSRTAAEDRSRLARGLQRFPALREAYERGEVGLEASLLLRRTLGRCERVGPDAERAWVTLAREVTIKRLRDEARAVGLKRSLGSTNGQVAPNGQVLPQDDAEWHASLRREPGNFRERVRALGLKAAALGVSDVFLRLRLPAELAVDLLASVEARRRELAEQVKRDGADDASARCRPGPTKDWLLDDAAPSLRIARTFSNRCRQLPSWVGLLALIEEFVETWDDPRGIPKRHADAVYARDGWRCSAPACSSRRNLEDHHVVYRSRCGADDLSNRICLCRFHHRLGEHGELASCRGRAPTGIVWRLGKKGHASWYRNERRLAR